MQAVLNGTLLGGGLCVAVLVPALDRPAIVPQATGLLRDAGVSVNCCLLLPSCTSLTCSVVATSSTPVSCSPVLARDQAHRLLQ